MIVLMFMSPLLNVAHDFAATHVVVATDAITVQFTPVEHIAYVAEVLDVDLFAFLVSLTMLVWLVISHRLA